MKKTVVISCAGKGTRLNHNVHKCRVDVMGKTIIERQLEQLKNVDEIIVVVGFKAEELIQYIKGINDRVKFVYNYDYENTATGASFTLGAKAARNEFIIALDGDLLVHPSDMENILKIDEEFVCGVKPNTENPVFMKLDSDNRAIDFNRDNGELEWSGLGGIKKEHIKDGKWYVCDIMKEILPVKTIVIRAREIDTPRDYEEAKRWISNDYDNALVLDEFFHKRFSIKDNYVVSRYSSNNRIDYDFDFIRNFINPNSSVLDLGCGTGIMEERLAPHVKHILAVDKYQEFIDRAFKAPNVKYISEDITKFNIDQCFNLILLWGISIYISDEELIQLLRKIRSSMYEDSTLIMKNQWGIESDVIVNKFSEQLNSIYYAKYRKLDSIRQTVSENGFSCNVHDIYPPSYNKWNNTHEYALVLRKK